MGSGGDVNENNHAKAHVIGGDESAGEDGAAALPKTSGQNARTFCCVVVCGVSQPSHR